MLIPSDTIVHKYINDTYFVTCTAPNSESISWTKGTTKKIDHSSKGVYTEDGKEPTVFEGISKKDKGDYICKAKYSNSLLLSLLLRQGSLWTQSTVSTGPN